MLSYNQKQQLQALKDIFDISGLCSTQTFIWGGMVIDIMEGCFLREHRDIDCFTLNLLDVKEKMDRLFIQKGYSTDFVTEIDMYKVQKENCRVAFNRLEIQNETAMWRHIGNQGTLYFPRTWLKDAPMIFYNSYVFVSGIEFEYAIKAKVNLLNPEWQLRESDKFALEYFTDTLEKHHISPVSVLGSTWSDNPYWRNKGYKEY